MLKALTISSDKPEHKPTVEKLAYSIEEAAAALGISYISVFRLLKRGKLKSCRALRHHMIPKSELMRFLKATLE